MYLSECTSSLGKYAKSYTRVTYLANWNAVFPQQAVGSVGQNPRINIVIKLGEEERSSSPK